MRLPGTYYILALVAAGAAAVTVLLAHLLGEADWWLTALFAFDFSLSLRLFLYIAFALILPESASDPSDYPNSWLMTLDKSCHTKADTQPGVFKRPPKDK